VLTASLALLAQCLLGGSMASQWAADRCLSAGEACRWLWLHRLGAWPAAVAVLALAPASFLPGAARPPGRALALGAGLLVLAQVALGVLTLRLQLAAPAVTIAHQLVAALLVAVLGGSLGDAFPGAPRPAPSFSPSPHTLEVVHG
jgi:cytochrome c oxidase assembly protein subunit 15